MAAFCGLIGFLMVYHYATFERPIKHFAIVIDAGSTQTRSGLFTISVDTPELVKWTNKLFEDEIPSSNMPLNQFLQVHQISNCVNGGPLAALQSQAAAYDLVHKCLVKFVDHIKRLDFIENRQLDNNGNLDLDNIDNNALESEEVSKQLALMDHRVTSVTHLYLGATAGMRSLRRVNQTRAMEKLLWVDRAINESNSLLLPPGSPFINKGFVGIIKGSDEAGFGWISVNFICDNLVPRPENTPMPLLDSISAPETRSFYDLDGGSGDSNVSHTYSSNNATVLSVGTLELGGASAQMAYQAPDHLSASQIRNSSLFEQHFELFNGHYRLATRSDLCLGMTQAVLRLNYILLREFYQRQNYRGAKYRYRDVIELENSCLQRGAQMNLTGVELGEIWRGACLAPSDSIQDSEFVAHIVGVKTIRFIGTGEVNKCGALLSNLIEPQLCRRYFSICPSSKNRRPAPSNMPFVTISGYNHALNVLDLTPRLVGQDHKNNKQTHWQDLEQTIQDKLGGNTIDYKEFGKKTRQFCSTHANELLKKYPKVNKVFQSISCLQLVYIDKLLTEFYLFDPLTSWSQIKFLLFTPSREAIQTVAGKKLDIRRDIGWTLGLLLNATSEQLSGKSNGDAGQIFFHHGASVQFVMRATVFIMLACCFIATSLLVIGAIQVRRAQSMGAYLSHSPSPSSYDVTTAK